MASGILALWNDCLPEHLADYEAWYTTEHFPERLGMPGWVRGRRYSATGEGPGFFTYYEVGTPEDLVNPVYEERVNNPTPWTQRIMTNAFRNLSRTICEVEERVGRLRGAWAVTLQLGTGDTKPDPAALVGQSGVVRAEIWRAADLDAPAENAESRLRGSDTRIEACLFVETVRREDAERVAATLPGARVWQFLCELEAEPDA